MNRLTIRRFDIIRTANVVAILYAVIILVAMLVFFVPFALIAGVASTSRSFGIGEVMGAGIVGVLIGGALLAVFYAIVGWIMTAIMCALYNFVAGRVGGIRVEVDLEGPMPGGPGFGAPIPPGYQPGYGTPPAPYSGYPGGAPPSPPAGWGQPQG